MDIQDVAKAIKYIFENEVKHHDYNIALKESYSLSDIATIVKQVCGTSDCIRFEKDSLNDEYTCSTDRYSKDFNIEMTDLKQSISGVFNYWFTNKELIHINEIDGRWK